MSSRKIIFCLTLFASLAESGISWAALESEKKAAWAYSGDKGPVWSNLSTGYKSRVYRPQLYSLKLQAMICF